MTDLTSSPFKYFGERKVRSSPERSGHINAQSSVLWLGQPRSFSKEVHAPLIGANQVDLRKPHELLSGSDWVESSIIFRIAVKP